MTESSGLITEPCRAFRYGTNRLSSILPQFIKEVLLSLVLMKLLGNIGDIMGLKTLLWYFNDATFIATRDTVSNIMNSPVEKGLISKLPQYE